MNEPTPILFGASVRAAASSCRRAGIPCRGADLFADVDTRALGEIQQIECYPSDFCAVADSLSSGPWFYTGGLENYPDLIDQISRRHRLWGNNGDAVRRVRDPLKLHQVLVEHDLPSPEVVLDSPDDSTSWIRKPVRSCGGMAIEITRASSRDCYFQEYLEGEPMAAVFVAGTRVQLLGVTYQLQGQPWTCRDFQYAGSVGPIDLTARQEEQVTRLGGVIAQAFGLKGIFGVDGIMQEQDFWTVEVNPRYTASVEVLERAKRKSAIQEHAAVFLGDAVPVDAWAESRSQRCHGKVIVFAKRAAVVGVRFGEFVRRHNANDLPGVADIPHAGSTIGVGQPVCTLFMVGDSEADVTRRLEKLVQQCHQALDVATL